MARLTEAFYEASINSFREYTMLEMLLPFLQLLSCIVLYIAGLVVYRLKFHRAAHIPGPTLAKVTFLYEWYYDLYLPGQYAFKLKELHKIYGIVHLIYFSRHIH